MKKFKLSTIVRHKGSKQYAEVVEIYVRRADDKKRKPGHPRSIIEVNLFTGHTTFEARSPDRLRIAPYSAKTVALHQD